MDAVRVVLGLFAAVLVPYGIPYLGRSRVIAVAVSAGFGAYVVAPLLAGWRGWVLLAVLLVWAVLLARWRIADRIESDATPDTDMTLETDEPSAPGVWRSGRERTVRILVAGSAILTLLATSLLVSLPDTLHALRRVVGDDRIPIVLSGFLIAVFISHEPVVLISSQFSESKELTRTADLLTVDRLGIAIGWFERALIFLFVLGGQVAGAALALTAKSLARYPALERKEISGEYFLVGTFSSVLIAMLAAVLTRACLGLSPI